MTPAMQDFNGVQGKQYGTCLAAMTLCFVELPMRVSVWGLRKGSLTLKKQINQEVMFWPKNLDYAVRQNYFCILVSSLSVCNLDYIT